MPGAPTTNLGLTVPTVGGDVNTWGTELNADLAIIDQLGAVPVLNVSANFNIQFPTANPEVQYNCTTGALGIAGTLPSAAQFPGRTITFKKVDPGVGLLTLIPQAGQLVEGAGSFQVPNQGNVVRFRSDGGINWWRI